MSQFGNGTLCTVCGKPNCQFSCHTHEDIQLIHELQKMSRAQLQFKILELTNNIQALYDEERTYSAKYMAR